MSYLIGLGIGLGLIVAIGAQNAFVLRQGIRREHVFSVALVCSLSDVVLIIIGVSGIGVLLQTAPMLYDIVRWVGAAFLILYGVFAARRAMQGTGTALTTEKKPTSEEPTGTTKVRTKLTVSPRTVAILTALAFTWLNPQVYLDALLLLGSTAQAQGDGKWLFAAGAITASFAWFFALGYGARYLAPLLSTERAWRILDSLIALMMFAIALSLILK